MKIHRFFSIFSIAMLSSVCFAQTVSNVRFEQVDNKVKITYSLDKQADISVCVSEDGGKTWSSPLKQVSGDVGTQVQPGSKTIWWDAFSEYDQLVGTNLCFKVMTQHGHDLTFTVKGVTFTMVYVQGGTFTMGATAEQEFDAYEDEKPAHRVTLGDYYIGKYEVTQGLWKAVMEENPANFRYGDSYPVEQVSVKTCLQFINELNGLLHDQLDGKRFALPMESQWEYAARGRQQNQHYNYKYAGSNDLSSVAWYRNNSAHTIGWSFYVNNSDHTTHPVGQKVPNELGLYDMSGNVSEWCSDIHEYNSADTLTRSYRCALHGDYHLNRGGNFWSERRMCRVSSRSFTGSENYAKTIGFRLVLLP